MELKKHITNPDTGISYTLVGDYYLPDFSLNFTDKRESFGKYGKMYFDFIKNYRKPYFNYLVITSTLFDTVKDIENQCHEMLDRLIVKCQNKKM